MSTVRRSLQGLTSLALPGSLFSTGVLLWFGYSSQLVYTIGDTRQLLPLFLGIIVGSILFSLVGYLASPTRMVLSLETLVAALLLLGSYATMALDSLVLDGTMIWVVSLAMTSALAPVGTLLRLNGKVYTTPVRAALGTAQGALTILFVFVYAFYYETSGQVDFFAGPLILLILSLVYFLVLLRLK